MKDTSQNIDDLYRQRLLALPGEKRFLIGDSMYSTARQVVVASIKSKSHRTTPEDLRRALLLRFYGHEFSVEKRQKILAAITEKATKRH